jgi:hypothetical protein
MEEKEILVVVVVVAAVVVVVVVVANTAVVVIVVVVLAVVVLVVVVVVVAVVVAEALVAAVVVTLVAVIAVVVVKKRGVCIVRTGSTKSSLYFQLDYFVQFPKPIVDVISQVTRMPNDLVTRRKTTTRTARSKVGKGNGKGHKAEELNF